MQEEENCRNNKRNAEKEKMQKYQLAKMQRERVSEIEKKNKNK